jgi:5-formyltetrahydrofolate cyclo-ligase
MIGFDNRLYRLGYGGGYYDALLAEQPTARMIGVCFDFGHLVRLPNDDHDIPMDIVITEQQTYSSRS